MALFLYTVSLFTNAKHRTACGVKMLSEVFSCRPGYIPACGVSVGSELYLLSLVVISKHTCEDIGIESLLYLRTIDSLSSVLCVYWSWTCRSVAAARKKKLIISTGFLFLFAFVSLWYFNC